MNTATPSGGKQDAPQQNLYPRLAYLLSSYPAISHTFFLNEITELRKLGFTIDVASINKPVWASGSASELEAAALQTTFYVKAMNPGRVLLVLLKIMFTKPGVVFRGLRSALQLDGWNLTSSSYALFYLAEALLLGDWLTRRGHKHLHIHFGGPVATVGMLTSMAWQFSYSLMIHGPEEFYDVEKSYLRRKVERAKFVLCISDYCRSQVMKVSDPEQWGKLHVVRLGVNPQVFAPAAPPVNDNGALEIICVGRFVPDKGHLILLHAFSDLLREGHNLRLRLVGDGGERCRMESFVNREQIDAFVTFEGALNHQLTRQKLARADIFVLASFAEGLPVALMEAMAMEIPCISTLVAGIPELIRDGREGLLVPASSKEALCAALARLISDAAFRKVLAQAARRRVQEFYDLGRNVGILADTLQTCLAEPSELSALGLSSNPVTSPTAHVPR
jgi:colanic acid/amylovoran biosynthesis glycosyltransferase